MVEIINDRFQKKVFINVQGKDGNITPYMSEQANLGFYKREDPNTEVIELLYPITAKKELYRTFSRLECKLLDIDNQEILVIFFFNGESHLVAGKIVTDLGVGPFHLENRMDSLCKGASNITIWAIWNCSREVKQLEARSKQEWSSDDDKEGSVSVVSTYSCQIG